MAVTPGPCNIEGNSDEFINSSSVATVGFDGQGDELYAVNTNVNDQSGSSLDILTASNDVIDTGSNVTISGNSGSGDALNFTVGDNYSQLNYNTGLSIKSFAPASTDVNDVYNNQINDDLSLDDDVDDSLINSDFYTDEFSDDDIYDDADYSTDPLILNFDGQSAQTQSAANSTASFDMQNNGQLVQTGWLTGGEGVLVYDTSGVAITQDSQLVAGFSALDKLAQSGSGTLDSSNPIFNDLSVWIDPTGNAEFQTSDLHTLQQLGITSINLNAQRETANSNGNIIVGDSTFTWNGGQTGDIAGVDLFYNPNSFASTLGQTAPTIPADMLTTAVQELGSANAGSSLLPPENSLNMTTALLAASTSPTGLTLNPAQPVNTSPFTTHAT